MHYVQVLLAAALLGLAGLLVKPLTGEASALSIAGYRSCFAVAAVLLLWAIEQRMKGGRVLPLPLVRNQWQQAAAWCKAVNSIAFATALIHSSTAAAFLLCNSTPICILVWQLIFERRLPTIWQLACAGVVAVGSILYFQGDPLHGNAVGITAGVIGGLSFAGFFYCQGKLAQTEANKASLSGSVILGDLLTIPTAFGLNWLLLEAFSTNLPASGLKLVLPFSLPTMWAFGLLAVLGVVQSGLAGWLLAKGQRGIDPILMAFVPTLITLWAPLLTWKYLGETFVAPGSVLGFILVHAAIVVASVYRVRLSILPGPTKA